MLGEPMTSEKLVLPFDHVAAHEHISREDARMADLIARTGEFQFKLDVCDSVYESLLEAITYQSISGKAAATIFGADQGAGRERDLSHARGDFEDAHFGAAEGGIVGRKSAGDEGSRAKDD